MSATKSSRTDSAAFFDRSCPSASSAAICFSVMVICGAAFAGTACLAGAAAFFAGAAALPGDAAVFPVAGTAVFAATFAGAAVFLAAGAGFLAGGIMISREKLASRQPARIAPIRTTTPAAARNPGSRIASTRPGRQRPQAGNFGNSIRREYDHPSMKANTVASGRPSDPTTPEGNDAETGMRRSLGLGTAVDPDPAALSSNDPMKAARQAIRSQTARDHAERELVHAEATIQELRTKLHHAHREKDAALEAARLATAAKLAAQRSMLEAEASRDRSDRALREALANNRDLQAKLDACARGSESAKAEPVAERQTRLKADDSRLETLTVPAREVARPAGHNDAVIQTIRRPVGRPRKTAAMTHSSASNKTAGKVMDSDEIIAGTAGDLQTKARNRQVAEQEPVQWWVEGWNGRRS